MLSPATTPRTLLRDHLDRLSDLIPAVRDAAVDPIHDARVETRRIRELLPLVGLDDRLTGDLRRRFRRVGRALGRLREVDVMRERLHTAMAMVPTLATSATLMDVGLARRQLRLQRRMIKRLERVEVEDLLSQAHRAVESSSRLFSRDGRAWAADLRARIATHAATVEARVAHASGVYLPARSHATRIAVKKLRYAVEVARETGVWQRPKLLKDLKRIQESLGDIHDLQVLRDELSALPEDHLSAGRVDALRDLFDYLIQERHAAFLAQRPRLALICSVCRGAAPATRLQRLVRRVA